MSIEKLRARMTWILQLHSQPRRGVAQPGRAPGSGPGGRRFKSSLPDQSFQSDIRGGAAQAFDHAGISNTGISNTMGARNGRAARVGTSRRKNLGERQSPKFRSLVVQRPNLSLLTQSHFQIFFVWKKRFRSFFFIRLACLSNASYRRARLTVHMLTMCRPEDSPVCYHTNP